MTVPGATAASARRPVRECLAGAAICMGLSCLPSSPHAETFPGKTVRLILRSPPGGADDIQARLLTSQLAPILGQQVVIDYRPGAGGLVAWEYIAKAPPDGYAIMLTASGLTSVRALRPSVTIDPWRDYAWISEVSTFMLAFTGHPSLPVKSLKDVIALARRRPGELTYGSTGVGATPHLSMEYFKAAARIDIAHVPYRGAGPMYVDLLGGRIELGTSTTGSAVTQVKSGRLRGLAVTGGKRLVEMPDIPTVAESAGIPGWEFTGFYAIIAPAGTPRDIVQTLSTAIARAIGAPGFKEKFRAAAPGMEAVATTPEAILDIARRDGEKVDRIIRDARIKAE
ncbi:MAG: tripartite tricarboxylate transporter substrate binding protein [Burkholderiales bacterium]|nr:tripartite tricarboxylate transporter substrate binding protein [Burkholderiales bacterium]